MNPFTAGLHYSAVAIFIGAFLYWILRCMSNKWCKGKSDNLCAKLLMFFFAISIPALCCVPAGGALGMVTGCAAGTVAAFGGAELLSTTEVEAVMQDTATPIGKLAEKYRKHKLEECLKQLEGDVELALADESGDKLTVLQEHIKKARLPRVDLDIRQAAQRHPRRLTSPPTGGERTRPKNPMDALAARLF